MNEQVTSVKPRTPIPGVVSGKWINEEFLRWFNEEFDRAERAKQENDRRLEARLAELRAQRAAR
jgi:hypothetical protein